MQQILMIHGGDSYTSYDAYLQNLQGKTYSLEKLRGTDWKSTLQHSLGKNYDVLRTSMPNKDNAKYAEWKIVMEKIASLLSEDIILLGHSLGGLFLAKFLNEEPFPTKIKATILIASPYSTTDHDPITDFTLNEPLNRFEKQGGKIFLFHSNDDPVVPFSDLALYEKALPKATSIVLPEKAHFNQPDFPELVVTLSHL